MKFSVEQYGNKIAVDGNLSELIENKKVWLLLTITNDDNTHRNQYILTKKEADKLVKDIQDRINDPRLKNNGFSFV